MIKRTGIFAVCAAALFFFAGTAATAKVFDLGLAEPEDMPQRNVVMIDLPHQYDLNPHTASYTSEAQILSGLYEGLFSYDPVTLDPLNALCTSYKISRDKKRWTFKIREGATFSDGEAITAQSFRDSWIQLLSTPNAPYASLLDCIMNAAEFRDGKCAESEVGIAARDEHTLVVHLNEPAEHLPRILCHHAFCVVSKKSGVFSGPFILRTFANKKLELEKNEKYHDAAAVKIPGITVLQSDNQDDNAYLFNTGKADWVASGNVTAAKIINKNSVHVSAEFGTSFMFFKMNGKSWNTTAFRNALLEAVPYDELRGGLTVPAKTLVYPIAGYPDVPGIEDYDSDDAVLLMKRARTDAGIPLEQKIPLVFAITDTDFMKKMADILKKSWEPLGVTLTVQVVDASRYNASITSLDADLFLYSWIGDFADPLAFLELFRGGSSLNVSMYRNSRFDELLVQASRADSSSEHYSLLAKAELQLLDDGMIIPVYHPISLHIINLDAVGGWQMNALDLHPLKYLYIKRQEISLPNLVMVR